ncbi:MAG TPA: anaerobic ribonucleoside-triphosphate reductase activating protein [Bacteroidales bacterium]|nr:anaerobic ribonucleoside-triphosphate reductase activating protein [Bacteroidales bacterium]
MRIGGFVKQSLIDYPGKIAAVVFTQGCNFRCGYCHNPQLVLPELFIEHLELAPINIISYLAKHKNWLDGVVVTGGEPTIHKDLPLFLKELKDLGYSIKLDTNGSNPYMLEQIVENKLVDYIAMDIKIAPEKDLYGKIIGIQMTDEIIEKIMVSILLLNNTSIEGEFRTTFIPGIHDEATVNLIQRLVGQNKSYKVNEFREGKTIEKSVVSYE